MPTTHLTDRAVLTVAGPDAEHFLHNLVTCAIEGMPLGEARPGALLTPQGKVMFDFLIGKLGDSRFLIDVRADKAAELAKRLMLYKLRAKVDISSPDQSLVAVSWQSESGAQPPGIDAESFSDTRFSSPISVQRHYGSAVPADDATVASWHEFRISQGIPEAGADYDEGDVFAHDALLDQIGAVSFSKGCFVGQEVVSRMQHRGTARRRFLIARAASPLPDRGTAITAAGKPIGTLGSTAGTSGLALVRIDRLRDALNAATPIVAGTVEIELTIPSWATFTLPESPGKDA